MAKAIAHLLRAAGYMGYEARRVEAKMAVSLLGGTE